ncbi:50S ribosomal protein L24 [Patescibacteria group bacterium]|nr:50S ribosomal protein L24 [Patescibacteria group bacterium]
MPKCVYCGKQYEIPKGTTLVMNDGTINYLCSSKCRKNMQMKKRKVRWVSKQKKDNEKSDLKSLS